MTDQQPADTHAATLVAQALHDLADRKTRNGNGPRAAGDQPGELARVLKLTAASTIKPRPVFWLWEDRIPLSSLTLIGGREGMGKTTIAYQLAADITRGTLPGYWHGKPRGVIVAATEDSWEHTIVPRLMAAGADRTKVYRVDVEVATEGRHGSLTLPLDIAALGDLIDTHDVGLLLLDPLMSRISGKLDTHKDAEVRQALEPLTRLADQRHCAILGLIHVNKNAKGDAMDRLMGSRAFAAVARAVLFVMRDPDNPEQRLANTTKNSVGRSDLPTLVFRIVNHHVCDTDEGPVYTGRVEWLGETERSIGDALEDDVDSETRSAVGEAKQWLEDHLTIQGRTESKRVKDEGKKAGHSESAIKRAASRLRVHAEPVGFPRITYWTLPAASVAAPTPGGPRDDPDETPRSREPLCYRCDEAISVCTCPSAKDTQRDENEVAETPDSIPYTPSPQLELTDPTDLTDLTDLTGITGRNGQNGHSRLSGVTVQVSPGLSGLTAPTGDACSACGDPDGYCGCSDDLAILNPA